MQEFNMPEPGNTEGNGPQENHDTTPHAQHEEHQTAATPDGHENPTPDMEEGGLPFLDAALTPEEQQHEAKQFLLATINATRKVIKDKTGEDIGEPQFVPGTDELTDEYKEKLNKHNNEAWHKEIADETKAAMENVTPEAIINGEMPSDEPKGTAKEEEFKTAVEDALLVKAEYEEHPDDERVKAKAIDAVKKVIELREVGDEAVRKSLKRSKDPRSWQSTYYVLISLALVIAGFAKTMEIVSRLAGGKVSNH